MARKSISKAVDEMLGISPVAPRKAATRTSNDALALIDHKVDHEALLLSSSVNILNGYNLLFQRAFRGDLTGADEIDALRHIKAQAAAIHELATKLETLFSLCDRLA